MSLPYIVVRSNNIELNALEEVTRSNEVENLLNQLEDAKIQLENVKQDACHCLFVLASKATENHRPLINLKSKISAGKNLPHVLQKFDDMRNTDQLVKTWFENAEQLLTIKSRVSETYKNALEQSRQSIKQHIDNEHFSKAISFTRGDINSIVNRYLRNPSPKNKKQLNDEDTILRYLNRAITKVSPFSSFTSIGFASLAEHSPEILQRTEKVADKFSFDRSVVLKIYEKIVKQHKQNWKFRFSSNQLQKDNQLYFYSFMDNEKVYPFRTSIVKARLPQYGTNMDQWMDYQQILSLASFSSNPEELINKWLQAGVLLYDLRLDDQSRDIFVELEEKLTILQQRGFKHPALFEKVSKIRSLSKQLLDIEYPSIPALVQSINDHINELSEIAGYQMIKSSGLVYHDTYHPKITPCDKGLVDNFGQQMSEFLHTYLGGNYDNSISQTLTTHLRGQIDPAKSYSLFEFYDLATIALKNNTPKVHKKSEELDKLLSLFSRIWAHRNQHELCLPDALVLPKNKPQPFSAYGHVVDNNFILNCVDSGYLRVFSRFFTFTDDEKVLQACRDAYGDTLEQAYDFYDTFGFNTGRRPRISGKRIWIDDFESQQQGDVTLSNVVLQWKADQKHPQIFLKGQSEPINIRHTALFVTQLYPKLLELLVRFSMSEENIYFATRFGIYDKVANSPEQTPVMIPRVRYKNIVISRKQWWFKKSDVPQPAAGENGEDFFLRLDAWRRTSGLNQRTFVRRHMSDKVLDRDISNAKKPMFIDFSSPIQARPIARILRTEFDYISFEEMLPDHNDSFVLEGKKRFAAEIIFEQVA